MLRYAHPFEEAKAQLEVFKDRRGPHALKIDSYRLEMMIAGRIRSAEKIRSEATLEQLDALCSVLESAEQNARMRAVK